MRVEDVLAPVSVTEFIEGYLGERMLLVPGSSQRFGPLVSWDELNDALNALRVSGPRLRLQQNGKPLDPETYLWEPYSESGSQIRGAALERLLAAGATLVLDKADELFAHVRALAGNFEEIFRLRVRANLYAGWRTDNGLNLHFDGHDTLILQVHGRKHWKVYEPTRRFPFKDEIEQAPEPTADPLWEGILDRGGTLYLPRGWWHVASPLDEPSLHLTFGLSHPHGRDILSWFAGEMQQHEWARADVPHLKSADQQRAWVDAFRQGMMMEWNDRVLDRFMASRDAQEMTRPNVHLPDASRRHVAMTPETRLRLDSGRGLRFSECENGQVSFSAGNRVWTCPAHLVPALSRLNHLHAASVDELCTAVPESAHTELKIILGALAMQGVVSIQL